MYFGEATNLSRRYKRPIFLSFIELPIKNVHPIFNCAAAAEIEEVDSLYL